MFRWFSDRGLLWFVRIGFMLAISLFNFWLAVVRWGWESSDPRVQVSAVLVAGGTELGLFAFLILFNQRFYMKDRRFSRLWGWGLAALLAVLISLYVNIGYFEKWTDPDGNAYLDLAIRGGVPMIFLVAFSLIPPKERKVRSQEDIDQEYDSKIHLERRRQELALTQTQMVQDRREKQVKEQAAQRAMLRIATQINIISQYQVRNDGFLETDWMSLEEDLALRGLWDSERQRPILTRTVTATQEEQQEPANVITDARMPALPAPAESTQAAPQQTEPVAASVPAKAKSNGHAPKEGGDAGSSRPFRFPRLGKRNREDDEEESDDDWPWQH